MSNMSYCRFENTNRDLWDCVQAMEEAYCLSEMDLSKDEHEAMFEMADSCADFLRQIERLRYAETFTNGGEK